MQMRKNFRFAPFLFFDNLSDPSTIVASCLQRELRPRNFIKFIFLPHFPTEFSCCSRLSNSRSFLSNSSCRFISSWCPGRLFAPGDDTGAAAAGDIGVIFPVTVVDGNDTEAGAGAIIL